MKNKETEPSALPPRLRCVIQGVRPLIMHSDQVIDRLNPYAIAKKPLKAKKTGRTEAETIALERLDWMSSLYWSEALGRAIIPTDNLLKCIEEGAKTFRKGDKVRAGVFFSDDELVIEHEDKEVKALLCDKEAMHASPRMSIRKGTVLERKRILSVRPMIPTGWRITCRLEYDESVINLDELIRAVFEGGRLKGLGDWRPKFGRFQVLDTRLVTGDDGEEGEA